MDLTYGGNSPGSGSANAASRGRGGFARGGRNQGGHGGQNNQRGRGLDSASARGRGNVNNASQRGGGRGGYNNNHHRAPPSDGDERPLCQVCFKSGHTVDRCWHRYNENYVPDPKLVAAAMNSYTIDNNWYTDTGATDHITGELEKLSFRNKYNGGDQIHTTSGAGMNISHIGHTTVRTPNRDIHLKNVLYVPQATKNLASVHKLASDNSAFLEFHPNFFLIKDQATKNTILRGKCHNGLYPLPSFPIKQACGAAKIPLSRWHCRLGHPSSTTVKQVVSRNNLSCLDESSSESVCNACQQAKSHQLPYSRSSSVSTFPLELVFSDVWGPAPESVGRKKILCEFY
jgi:histone deacetylase 1/2